MTDVALAELHAADHGATAFFDGHPSGRRTAG